jgi:hypothetical protein
MSENGPSRHFAGLQNFVAVGGIADIGTRWRPQARSLVTHFGPWSGYNDIGRIDKLSTSLAGTAGGGRCSRLAIGSKDSACPSM